MSISQFLALRGSGLQGVQAGLGQGDRISGVLDQHPDLAGVVVGVAVGDARSYSKSEANDLVNGAAAGSITTRPRLSFIVERLVSRPGLRRRGDRTISMSDIAMP